MKILEYLNLIIYGFFMIFFIYYIGSFGLADFIVEGNTKSIIVLNTGIWLVLIMFCADKFFRVLGNTRGKE